MWISIYHCLVFITELFVQQKLLNSSCIPGTELELQHVQADEAPAFTDLVVVG